MIEQGINFLGFKENFKSDINNYEDTFYKDLKKYKNLYKKLNDDSMSEIQKINLKNEIKEINQKLMNTIDKLNEKIIGLKKDNKEIPKNLQNLPNLLKKYENINNKFSNGKKLTTYSAMEEDFQLKTEMLRIRYIIWASMAIILFLSSIFWLVNNL